MQHNTKYGRCIPVLCPPMTAEATLSTTPNPLFGLDVTSKPIGAHATAQPTNPHCILLHPAAPLHRRRLARPPNRAPRMHFSPATQCNSTGRAGRRCARGRPCEENRCGGVVVRVQTAESGSDIIPVHTYLPARWPRHQCPVGWSSYLIASSHLTEPAQTEGTLRVGMFSVCPLAGLSSR